jgi:spoIIIJ-associated protein
MTDTDTDTDTDTTLPSHQAAPDNAAADGTDGHAATEELGQQSASRLAADTGSDEQLDDELDDAEDGDGKRGGSLLVREGDIAADYLERLLDIVDYDGDIDLDVENGRAMVAIVGSDLQPLIGQQGATLDALQELTRLAVQQQTGVRSRLMLDVSGHRRARRDELRILAQQTAEQVISTGEPVRLSAMNPFERKVVHDAIAALDGVISESEGEEPSRRVVVLPAP